MISVTCEAVCDNCGYRQKVTICTNAGGRACIPDAEEHMIQMGWQMDDKGQYCCVRCKEENEGRRNDE